MQKGKQIIALHMVEAADVVTMVVQRLQGAVRACASGTVEESDAKRKAAQRALRATRVFVFHMEVAGGVSSKNVKRVPKAVLCSARPMEEGSVA